MNMIIRKRQITLAILVVALGVAVYLNYHFADKGKVLDTTNNVEAEENLGEARFVSSTAEAEETSKRVNTEYFTQARLNRQQTHDEALEMLNAVLNNTSASDEAKKAAGDAAAQLAESLRLESDIESLVKAKGFKECFAIIQEDSAKIIVPKGSLSESETTRIADIVMTTAKIGYENVTIIEAE